MLSVRSSRKLTLELFPFISLFLCVIGVLAFLQNLLVMGEIGASEEDAIQPQIFQTPYRIETHLDRLVLHPPEEALAPLYEKLSLEEQAGVDQIVARRNAERASKGKVLGFGAEFDEGYLQIALNEIASINRLSKERGFSYEEYVLFEIHSGGSDAYHYLLRLLERPEYIHIRSGLDIGNANPAVLEQPQ